VDGVDARAEPFVARHVLLASLVLGAVTLGTAVTGSGSDPGDLAGAAPYGAAGCEAPAERGPALDVAVQAWAKAPDDSPAPALHGSGVEVGASVRDLSGYAAEGVGRCDVVHVAVHLYDPALGRSVPGVLEGPGGGAVDVPGRGGRGRLVAEDWGTWAETLPSGAPTDALEESAAWFVTLAEPADGEYVLRGRVTASTGASGNVEVVLTITPSTA